MEPNKKVTIRSIGIKYGIYITLGLVASFLILRAANLIQQPVFWYLKDFVVPAGIALALNNTRHILHRHRINYLPGLGTGVWAGIIASLLFAVFMFIYAKAVDPAFVAVVRPYLPFQDYVNAGMLAIVTFGETMVASVVSTFILMQFFKRNEPQMTEAQEEAAENSNPASVAGSPAQRARQNIQSDNNRTI